jgi:hypothetical protein
MAQAAGPSSAEEYAAMTTMLIANETKHKKVIAQLWCSAGIFVCTFLFLIVTMDRDLDVYDEGLILFGSVRVLSGDVPYRDFYANYGPAQFYALAALFKLFGTSVIVERMWDLLIRSSTILVIYLIIDRFWSRRTALFTVFAAALWLTNFGFYGYPIFPCLLFSLLSLYFTLPTLQGRRSITSLLAGGACLGIVVLFRYDVGVLAAIGGLFTLGLFHLTQDDGARRKRAAVALSAGAYISGIMLVSIPIILLLLSAVSLHDILLDLVYLPASTYARTRSLPFPSLFDLYQLIVYLPILGALVGGVIVFSSGMRNPGDEAGGRGLIQRWILVQLSALSTVFFLKGIVRVMPVHMALSIVPALMIVCVIVKQRQRLCKTAYILVWLAIFCLAIPSTVAIKITGILFAKNVVWARDCALAANSCHLPHGLERIRYFWLDQNHVDAISYIQQHTEENERIYVGVGRHDKIFVNDILFYFASKRLSSTKWHHFDPGIQTTKEIQSEIISELRMHPPCYVVLETEWDNVREPNESALSSGVTDLDNFLKANYRPVAFFGMVGIYELHSLSRGNNPMKYKNPV